MDWKLSNKEEEKEKDNVVEDKEEDNIVEETKKKTDDMATVD